MSNIPTPHINANQGDIAKTVLMPGDPLRAKFIAENYLSNIVQYNTVRGMYGYTGEYNGKRISVQGSGMGIPSIGIYSYELYNFYGVENIMRIGSAGAIHDDLNIGDIVIGMGACTNSNFASQYNLPGTFSTICDFNMLKTVVEKTEDIANKYNNFNYKIGNILSSDTFYDDQENALILWKKMGVLAVEMEAAGLYMNASRAGKKALCILTISDCPFKGTSSSSEERQNSFTNMMEIALNTALEI